MDNALLVGLSGQVALGRELEVVANNIANINTTGYKSDSSIFEKVRCRRRAAASSRPAAMTWPVRDRTTWHNFSAGPILRTGGPLDVAIDGDAFLVVQTAGGQRYTRNGGLQISPTGALVTNAGDPVVGTSGPIQFQNTDHDISIGEDGTVTVREGSSGTSNSVRGQLQLAKFADPATAEAGLEPVRGHARRHAATGARGRARGAGLHRAVEREPGRRDGPHGRDHPHL